MHPLKGELIEIYIADGTTSGKVRVDGSILHVPLLLLMHARVGDELLVDAGIALSVTGRGRPQPGLAVARP